MVSLHNYSTRLSVYKENSMSCRTWKKRLKKYSIYTDKEMSKVATMEAETIHYPSNWRDNMILAYGPNVDTQKWPTEPPNFM
jgi:hypothetical protein